jgi:hypothetical protein
MATRILVYHSVIGMILDEGNDGGTGAAKRDNIERDL